ncbi:MAG: hypothetical protein AMXMBFR33_72430 [Candidatus Xenobia bacterium]
MSETTTREVSRVGAVGRESRTGEVSTTGLGTASRRAAGEPSEVVPGALGVGGPAPFSQDHYAGSGGGSSGPTEVGGVPNLGWLNPGAGSAASYPETPSGIWGVGAPAPSPRPPARPAEAAPPRPPAPSTGGGRRPGSPRPLDRER